MKTYITHTIGRNKWFPWLITYEKKETKVRSSDGKLLEKNKKTVTVL